MRRAVPHYIYSCRCTCVHNNRTLCSERFIGLLFGSTLYNTEKMSAYKILFTLALFYITVKAQRPFYAGLRPIGYPEVETNNLANRFGEDADAPIEAKGDGNLINRLNALPEDSQPFWYLNWRQYDALRKNPQTYTPRPSIFANNN